MGVIHNSIKNLEFVIPLKMNFNYLNIILLFSLALINYYHNSYIAVFRTVLTTFLYSLGLLSFYIKSSRSVIPLII